MITFIPYRPEHLMQIDYQPAQRRWKDLFFTPAYARVLDVPDMAWTGLDEQGRVIGCAGFSPQWEGRVIGWAVFGKIPKAAWVPIFKKVRKEMRALRKQGHDHRVEITVPYGFGAGCRLAHLLGFQVEGLMRRYGPDGSDHYLYSQVVPCA